MRKNKQRYLQSESNQFLEGSPHIRSLTQKYKRSEKLGKVLEDKKSKIRQANELKQVQVKQNLEQIKREERERKRHLQQKLKEKSKAQPTIEFENEQRKEIMRLKMQDQQENIKREHKLQNLYKQRLINKLIEKGKAAKIKEQQDRISSLYVKRNQLKIP